MKSKSRWLVLSLTMITAFALAACGGAASDAGADCVNDCLNRAMAGEFSGEVVTMTGPFVDADAIKFNDSVASFEEATGIDIQYEGTQEFEVTMSIRVDGGDPPNIADFPQPGLMASFAASGDIVDVTTFLPDSALSNYNDSWNQMATVPGADGDIQAGVFHRFNGKSLVWYPIDDFEASGYAIPQTWDELMTLSDQILADGDTPWCVGLGSGAATGWVATDWMEDIMLRTTSLENYDAWVAGDLAFSSPEVTNAAEILADVWTDENVFGGRAAVVTTEFGDAPAPMFEEPPRCWMHRQGNFITSFFPESAEAGVDYGFFYLPPIDEEYGKPFLVAGDIMSLFKDSNAARAVMHYFTQGEAVKSWLAAGGALSPHLDAELDWYGNDVERGVAEIVAASTSFRFDASDLMPKEVGQGAFWEEMTNFFAGTSDMGTTLSNIDAAWPR